MDILTITDLQKKFGEKEVLRGMTLQVPENSIFGFIGRNGAGKTTTMKAVLGLLKADGGTIHVCGKQVTYGQTRTNQYIGYLPDVPEFYSYMTPKEYLNLCGEIGGMEKADRKARSDELLELVGLKEEKRRIKGFSRGMKQRLGIAQALLNRPKLLLCDEPTSALDPVGRKDILDILLSVREQTTVLFSTHILSDIERICTDVAFMDKGKIVMQGKMSEVKKQDSSKEFFVETIRAEDVIRLAEQFSSARKTDKNTLVFRGNEEMLFAVLKYITENQIPVQKVERMETSLESLFLEVAES